MNRKIPKEKEIKKLDILNNHFYANYLILIALGYNTYNKIREIKKILDNNEENNKLKLAPCVLNVQVKRLIDNELIKEDNVKRKSNSKAFLLKEGVLFQLFLKRLIERNEEIDTSKSKEERSIKGYFLTPGDTSIERIEKKKEAYEWHQKTLKKHRDKFNISKEAEERLSPEYILKNHSLEFQAFIEKSILYYFNQEFQYNILNVFNNSLAYHFDTIIKSFYIVYNNFLYPKYDMQHIIFDMQNEKEKEIYLFFELCEKLEGMNNNNYSSNFMYQIKYHYLGRENELKKEIIEQTKINK